MDALEEEQLPPRDDGETRRPGVLKEPGVGRRIDCVEGPFGSGHGRGDERSALVTHHTDRRAVDQARGAVGGLFGAGPGRDVHVRGGGLQRGCKGLGLGWLAVDKAQRSGSEPGKTKSDGPSDSSAADHQHRAGRTRAPLAAIGRHETRVIGVEPLCAGRGEDHRVDRSHGPHQRLIDRHPACRDFLVGVGDIDAAISLRRAGVEHLVKALPKGPGDQPFVGDLHMVLLSGKAVQHRGARLGDVVADQAEFQGGVGHRCVSSAPPCPQWGPRTRVRSPS